jgi:fido (protein-threonine AMPylation protein)
MFEAVEERRRRLDAFRPLSAEQRARLQAVLEPWFIYGSNAIEGNSLTLGDTIRLIRERRLPAGGSEEEYLEVKGQQAAYAHLQEAVASPHPPTEALIRELHRLLTGGLDPEKYQPGQYQDQDSRPVPAGGTTLSQPSPVATLAAVQELVAWSQGDGRKLHPVERAAWLHHRFLVLHPFRDGNGRTARLLTNLLLQKSGHGMAIFRPAERKRAYLDALRAVDGGVPAPERALDHPGLNLAPLVSYLEEELLWSCDLALDVLEGRVVATTADLRRRFAGLEQRSLAAAEVATGERGREDAAASVREVTHLIDAQVREVSDGLSSGWPNLIAGVRDHLGADVLELAATSARTRRDLLGIEPAAVLGTVGLVTLNIHRRRASPRMIEVPSNACEFVVFAEPDALTVAGIFEVQEEDGAEPLPEADRLRLPMGPPSSGSTEVKTFVVEQVKRFLERAEAEISRRNQPSAEA